jgi:ribosome-associated protein
MGKNTAKGNPKTMKTVNIDTEYITLGQFLKLTDLISTGGAAKRFLQTEEVYVNGERETRRGRKLRDGDEVFVPGSGKFFIKRSAGE